MKTLTLFPPLNPQQQETADWLSVAQVWASGLVWVLVLSQIKAPGHLLCVPELSPPGGSRILTHGGQPSTCFCYGLLSPSN
jgi:hypothetical protein